jgi:hypothetical protein
MTMTAEEKKKVDVLTALIDTNCPIQAWLFGATMLELRPDVIQTIRDARNILMKQSNDIYDASIKMAQIDDEYLQVITDMIDRVGEHGHGENEG